jgi:hypothetical protein
MNFAAINRLSIDEDLLQYLAYGYSFNTSICLYNDICKDANDFLMQFDHLIDDFLKRSGIRRYVAGNVVLFADYEERKLQEDDIEYCDAVAAMFTIYGHQVILRPCVMGLLSPNSEPKLSLDVKIPDYGNYHINRREAMSVIRQWVLDDQNNQLNGLGKHKRDTKVEDEQPKENPYVLDVNKYPNIKIIPWQKIDNPIDQLRNDVDKLAMDVASIKAEETKVEQEQWHDFRVRQCSLIYSTEKAFKFVIPDGQSEFGGWSFWWPRKRVRTDREDPSTLEKTYLLGYTNDQDEVKIERLKGDGTWEKETKTITIQQLITALNENSKSELPF